MSITLNQDQQTALSEIVNFIQDSKQDVFILRGSAGTGKTTLISTLISELQKQEISFGLLAPTGRASRILSSKTHQGAATVHRAIYSFDGLNVNEEAIDENDPGLYMHFPLVTDVPSESIFIVDESSMIGDVETKGDYLKFGSGQLLKDLFQYCGLNTKSPTVQRTKLIFVGDAAQLPPVGEKFSPALSDEYLQKNYQLNVKSYDLTKVMRQEEGSGILERATAIRDAIFNEKFNEFSLNPNQRDIEKIDTTNAINKIVENLQNKQSSVAIVYSNKTALDYNRSIRERIWRSADLSVQVGDTLLVNKNSSAHNLSNGDLVKVLEASAAAERVTINLKVKDKGPQAVDLFFRSLIVAYRGASGEVIKTQCFILENLLDSPERSITPIEQRALLVHFRQRHPQLRTKSDEFRKVIKSDPYFNALQVKYGYAMTCHKAQGGEWMRVIVDFESGFSAQNSNFFRWAYTAITRASQKLIVINPPSFSAISSIDWGVPQVDTQHFVKDGINDFKADPDWDRFSFNDSLAPLFPVHQQVRSIWQTQGIQITRLQHLQYHERYTVERDGKQAEVQYYYNAKYKVTSAIALPVANTDMDLAEEAAAVLKNVNSPSQANAIKADDFIKEFLETIKTALTNTDVSLKDYVARDYCIRVSFSRGYHQAQIDFHYNGKKQWTKAQEVGGAGSSNGILEIIQQSMESWG